MAPDPRTDERLLADFVGGEARAFDELVTRHEDRLFSLALRMTGERSDALDATQDAFVAAFRRAGSFRGDAAVGTWLYRIAINATQDLLRKRARNVTQDLDEPGHEQPAPGERVEDTVAARVDVARALASLPDEYRDAVVMHDLGGVPYDEIANLTGAPMGTVKSRISRGRRQLAELLEHRRPASTSKQQDPEATPGGAHP
ncbi:MAG TPA: sigma-70 family RNA polymerase sigma factor [Actinomycetota bacterium]